MKDIIRRSFAIIIAVLFISAISYAQEQNVIKVKEQSNKIEIKTAQEVPVLKVTDEKVSVKSQDCMQSKNCKDGKSKDCSEESKKINNNKDCCKDKTSTVSNKDCCKENTSALNSKDCCKDKSKAKIKNVMKPESK
jgi:hypothetical protein